MSLSMNELLWKQVNFEDSLGYHFDQMLTEEKVAYIKEYSLHMENELHEMLHELPFFKPWKQYKDVDSTFSAAKPEFVDVFHHMLNIALALGFTGDDLCEMYEDKLHTNYIRQKNPAVYKRCVDDAKCD